MAELPVPFLFGFPSFRQRVLYLGMFSDLSYNSLTLLVDSALLLQHLEWGIPVFV
jgi:hypothetical protein